MLELITGKNFTRDTIIVKYPEYSLDIPVFTGSFWESGQRRGNTIHEIPYRNYFKSELPRFYIEGLARPDSIVYDPFMGRGTTLIEAALAGRIPYGSDVSKLSVLYTTARLGNINKKDIINRIIDFDLTKPVEIIEDLLVFYEEQTLRELLNLREYFFSKELDDTDRWILLVTLTRLSGHSSGFISRYSMPPNQCVSIERQKLINKKYESKPYYRNIKDRLIAKTEQLLAGCSEIDLINLCQYGNQSKIAVSKAQSIPFITNQSVDIVITSPPFLDVLDYERENWLKLWFIEKNFDHLRFKTYKKDSIGNTNSLKQDITGWKQDIFNSFLELHRILVPGGYLVFETGEVRGICLSKTAIPLAIKAGLKPVSLMINSTNFTKTSHCWNVTNNKDGTNSNRVLICQKV